MRQHKLLRSCDAKPFRVQHKAPCSDCPWARKSLKGWLGPNSIVEWLGVARDYWFKVVCHTRKQINGEHWECAGAAIFRANTCVRHFGDHSAEGRRLLQLPANKITVFASSAEFEDHHKEIR